MGTYRVMCERDVNGEPLESDFTFLVGTGGNSKTHIYRFDDETLSILVRGNSNGKFSNMIKSFMDANVTVLDLIEGENEGFIHFPEEFIHTVAKIIEAKTIGSEISPESIKNHPRKNEIKKEKFAALSDEEKEARIQRGVKLQNILKNKRMSEDRG
jgi:hypothetical protein